MTKAITIALCLSAAISCSKGGGGGSSNPDQARIREITSEIDQLAEQADQLATKAESAECPESDQFYEQANALTQQQATLAAEAEEICSRIGCSPPVAGIEYILSCDFHLTP